MPTTLKPDGRSRRPHLRTWRDGWRHLRFMLLCSPRWLFVYPGISFALQSFVASCFLIVLGVQALATGLTLRYVAEAIGVLPLPPGHTVDTKRFLLLFLAVAAMKVHKNLARLVEAMGPVVQAHPDARLVIAGPPSPYGAELRRRADACGVGHACDS